MASNPAVELETSKGTIVLELYPDKAAKTVENFIQYVESGHFDGTLFHRVIPGFMIQGGGFDANERQKPTRTPVQNESDNGLSNEAGTIAMARTSNPHSATAQFFINLKGNTFLDSGKTPDGWGYTVFGKVTGGTDVVGAIAKVKTARGAISEAVPDEPVVILKARVLPAAE